MNSKIGEESEKTDGSRFLNNSGERQLLLQKQYPIHRVSKALRLNYTDLKNHSQPQNPIKPVENKTSTFVELDGSDVFIPSECIVEMEDSSGAKMRMCFRGKTDFDLLELGKTFWNHKR